MAVTRFSGGEPWRFNPAGDGTRVLVATNDDVFNAKVDDGNYWNTGDSTSTTDLNQDALLDIGGNPTPISLRTNAPFQGRVGDFGTDNPDLFNYLATIGSLDVWTDPYFRGGGISAEIELYGFGAADVVDLVIGGMRKDISTRGGIFRILNDGREAEAVSGTPNATGPIMFWNIYPVDGSIKIEIEPVTDFIYFNIIDFVIKKR